MNAVLRGGLLVDGSSDRPLARILEYLCRNATLNVEVVAIPADRFLAGTGLTVEARVRALLKNDPDFDILFVHRDAEAQDAELRFAEVEDGASAAAYSGEVVAVDPIRMTEAWLLLDEEAIRRVAGRPSGTNDLGLPTLGEVERVADPKAVLSDAIVKAADVTGRRRKSLRRRLPTKRRQLLESLDPDGNVRELAAWQRLESDLQALAERLP